MKNQTIKCLVKIFKAKPHLKADLFQQLEKEGLKPKNTYKYWKNLYAQKGKGFYINIESFIKGTETINYGIEEETE